MPSLLRRILRVLGLVPGCVGRSDRKAIDQQYPTTDCHRIHCLLIPADAERKNPEVRRQEDLL